MSSAASVVLPELTALSVVDWLTAAVPQFADESALETDTDLMGLAAATDDKLSVALDADFDTDDLQQPQCHAPTNDTLNTTNLTNDKYINLHIHTSKGCEYHYFFVNEDDNEMWH